jgi:chromosomal replication initiation ATPase DnaA
MDPNEAWRVCLEHLKDDLPTATFCMWLEPTICAGENNGALILHCPDNTYQWVRRRYGAKIGETVRTLTEYQGAYIRKARPVHAELF